MLFKLLCDPGDRVLVPRPSYPLFEHLTAIESVDGRALRARRPCRLAARRGGGGRRHRRADQGGAGGVAEQPDRIDHRSPRARCPGRARRRRAAWRSSATRCSPTIRLTQRRRRRVGAAAVAGADVRPGRPVEVRRSAAGEGGMDRRLGTVAARSTRRCTAWRSWPTRSCRCRRRPSWHSTNCCWPARRCAPRSSTRIGRNLDALRQPCAARRR